MEVKVLHILEHFEIGTKISGIYWVLINGCKKIVKRKNDEFFVIEVDFNSSVANMKLLSEEESKKIKKELEDAWVVSNITLYTEGIN